jgi:hypothetical protein
MTNNLIGKNVLITCQSWFIAPDGKQYRSAWGKLNAVKEAKEHVGFTPNRTHANWFIELGNMTIMGCQVLYYIECPEKPSDVVIEHAFDSDKKQIYNYRKPSEIYITI